MFLVLFYGLSVMMVYSWRVLLKDDVCKMENGVEMMLNVQVWNGDLKQVEILKVDKNFIYKYMQEVIEVMKYNVINVIELC